MFMYSRQDLKGLEGWAKSISLISEESIVRVVNKQLTRSNLVSTGVSRTVLPTRAGLHFRHKILNISGLSPASK
jgi:hypothetical protein